MNIHTRSNKIVKCYSIPFPEIFQLFYKCFKNALGEQATKHNETNYACETQYLPNIDQTFKTSVHVQLSLWCNGLVHTSF